MGVDRMTLARKIAARFGSKRKTFTIAEGVDALLSRSESEEARRRKNIAEAETAEIDAQVKRETYEPKSVRRRILADWATKVRVAIQTYRHVSKPPHEELLKRLAEIKPDDPK